MGSFVWNSVLSTNATVILLNLPRVPDTMATPIPSSHRPPDVDLRPRRRRKRQGRTQAAPLSLHRLK